MDEDDMKTSDIQDTLDIVDRIPVNNHEQQPEKTLLGPFVEQIDTFRAMMGKHSAIVIGTSVDHLFAPSEDTPYVLCVLASSDSLGDQGENDWHFFLTETCEYTYYECRGWHGSIKFTYIKDYRQIDFIVLDENPIEFVISLPSGHRNYATWDKTCCLLPDLTLKVQKKLASRDTSIFSRDRELREPFPPNCFCRGGTCNGCPIHSSAI
jgi:hypothetical protein